MPQLTTLAPGTWVTVAGMNLPNAVVSRVLIQAGVDPIVYEIEWSETPDGPKRKATYREAQVTERPGTPQPLAGSVNTLIPTPPRPPAVATRRP